MLCLQAHAAPEAWRRVLVIYSYHDAMPWQKSVQRGLQGELAEHAGSRRLLLYQERLDALRIAPSDSRDPASWFAQKYAHEALDLVVAESDPAVDLLRRHPELFPGAQRLYLAHGLDQWRPTDGAGFTLAEDLTVAVDQVLSLMPELDRLVVIHDQSLPGNPYQRQLEGLLADPVRQPPIELWHDFRLEPLLARVAALPQGTAVLFLPVLQDNYADTGAGASNRPFEMAQRLSAAAQVPVFAHHDVLVGSGAVGGYTLSGRKVGQLIARFALSDQQPEVAADFAFEPVFDYLALKRFNLDPDSLPSSTRLLNQPLSLWREYRWEIFWTTLALALQAALILALVLTLRTRREALAALELERRALEQRVAERTLALRKTNKELERLAMTDVLTGVANRRHILVRGEAELERARRYQHCLALLMADIDFFKKINDEHSHGTGDQALIAVANAIRGRLRSTDALGRLGGEEFVVLLPESDQQEALAVAERIRAAVAELVLSDEQDRQFGTSISLGVALFDVTHPVHSLTELMEQADQALYRAKSQGRNRVLLAQT